MQHWKTKGVSPFPLCPLHSTSSFLYTRVGCCRVCKFSEQESQLYPWQSWCSFCLVKQSGVCLHRLSLFWEGWLLLYDVSHRKSDRKMSLLANLRVRNITNTIWWALPRASPVVSLLSAPPITMVIANIALSQVLFSFVETGSHYVLPAGLECTMQTRLALNFDPPPACASQMPDFRCVPPCPALLQILYNTFFHNFTTHLHV